MKLGKFPLVLLCFCIWMMHGCGGAGGSTVGSSVLTGQLTLVSNYQESSREVPSYADLLVVTIKSPEGIALPDGVPNLINLNRSNRSITLKGLTSSSTPYVFEMKALADGNVVGTATRSILVSAGSNNTIDVSANIESTVVAVAIEGSTTLRMGMSAPLTAYAMDAQGATLLSGSGFNWLAVDPNILSVDKKFGIVTANDYGTSYVEATLDGTTVSARWKIVIRKFLMYITKRDGDYDIYSMDVKRGIDEKLLVHEGRDWGAVFSPNGAKVAFVSNVDGDYDLYVMNADGTDLQQLTYNNAVDFQPQFSPNSKSIVFRSNVDGDYDIYSIDIDGGNLTQHTDNDYQDYEPIFGPGSRQIYYASQREGRRDIYSTDFGSLIETRLTNLGTKNNGPILDPNRERILFSSNRDGNTEIYVMDRDGQNQTNLTNNNANDTGPVLSPDGTKLAFRSDRSGKPQIYIMDIDGQSQYRVSNNLGENYRPAFTPDGDKIAFFLQSADVSSIFIVDVDGTNERRLTQDIVHCVFLSFS